MGSCLSYLAVLGSTEDVLKLACGHFLGDVMSNVLRLVAGSTTGSVGGACGRKNESCLRGFARCFVVFKSNLKFLLETVSYGWVFAE